MCYKAFHPAAAAAVLVVMVTPLARRSQDTRHISSPFTGFHQAVSYATMMSLITSASQEVLRFVVFVGVRARVCVRSLT